MRYRAVLFDVDGTIVDSQRAVLKAFEKVLGELGLPAPDAQLKESALRGPGLRVLEGLGVKNAKEVGLRWGEYCAQEEKQLFPGIARVLRELREAGVQLGIVTSRTACETEIDPPVKSVLPMFDARVCAGETSGPSPRRTRCCCACTGSAQGRKRRSISATAPPISRAPLPRAWILRSPSGARGTPPCTRSIFRDARKTCSPSRRFPFGNWHKSERESSPFRVRRGMAAITADSEAPPAPLPEGPGSRPPTR